MKHFMSDKIFPLRLTVSAAAGNNEGDLTTVLQTTVVRTQNIDFGLIWRFEKNNLDGYVWVL